MPGFATQGCRSLYPLIHSNVIFSTSYSYLVLPLKDLRSWKETLLYLISESLCRHRTHRLPVSMTAAATPKAASLPGRSTTKTKESLVNFIDMIPQLEAVK